MKFYDKYIEILNKIKEIRGNIASVYRYLQQVYGITGTFKLKDLRKAIALIPIRKCKVTSISLPNDGSGIVPADIFWYSERTFTSGIFNTNRWAKYIDLTGWNTSNVTSTLSMFSGCANLKHIIGLEFLDFSNVTNINNMFNGVNLPNYILNLNIINNGKIKSVNGFLLNSTFLDIIGVENLDLSMCTGRADDTFRGCLYNKEIIDLSNWNVSGMLGFWRGLQFRGANIKLLDMHGWDTSNFTTIFLTWNGITYNIDISGWNVPKLVEITYSMPNISSFIGNHTIDEVESGLIYTLTNLRVNWLMLGCTKIRYSSILAVFKGIPDRTDQGPLIVLLNSTAWKNMRNDDDTIPDNEIILERLSTISNIASSKNWTITLA